MSRETRKKVYAGGTRICGNVCKTSLLIGVVTFILGGIFAFSQDRVESKERKERNKQRQQNNTNNSAKK